MINEIVLFKLLGKPVSVWPVYGVVMPDLATTNGSAKYAAKMVVSLVSKHGIDAVTENILGPLDFGDESAVATALTAAYQRSKT